MIKRHYSSVIGVLISLIALFWLSKQFNPAVLFDMLVKIKLEPLIIVVILVVISFSVRAERWRVLVKHSHPIRYWSSFSALMIGYLLNNLLPARAGDIARAMELSKSEQLSRAKVFMTLITERAFDLLVTLTLLLCVMLSYPKLPEWLKTSGVVASVALLSVCTTLCVFHFWGGKWVPIILDRFKHLLPDALEQKILNMLLSALEGVETLFNKKRASKFLFLTILLWVIEVLIVYQVAIATSLPLALGNALFVLLILAIGLMIPSSPGFLGTYEFFGIKALGLVGLFGPNALSFIILLHLISISSSTLLGAICLSIRHIKK
jgi:glycosyltransferase 2 family protein